MYIYIYIYICVGQQDETQVGKAYVYVYFGLTRAPIHIQGSSPYAPKATFGSVPRAYLPVCSLYVNRL